MTVRVIPGPSEARRRMRSLGWIMVGLSLGMEKGVTGAGFYEPLSAASSFVFNTGQVVVSASRPLTKKVGVPRT